MASSFTSVQFMDAPGGPGTLGAIKAGQGISISPDGTISTSASGGTITAVVAGNGLRGGATSGVAILELAVPTATTIGGVKTVDGSGISIDNNGVIRSIAQYNIQPGAGISVTNVTSSSSTVSTLPAGENLNARGTIWVNNGIAAPVGLSLTANGQLQLIPASSTKIGGVIVGPGLQIDPNGILSTVSSGTITGVIAGVGLSGGGTTGSVTLDLLPPTGSFIGGVKTLPNSGITINTQGIISVAPATASAIGGVIVGSGLNINSSGVLSVAASAAPTLQQVMASGATSDIAATFTNPAIPGYSTIISGERIEMRNAVGVGNDVITIDSQYPRILIGKQLSLSFTAGVASIGTLSPGGALRIRAGTGIEFTDESFLSVWASVNSTGFTIANLLTASGLKYPTADGTAGQVMVTDGAGNLSFAPVPAPSGVLQLSGGTMTGNITFAGGQSFPGVVPDTAFLAAGDLIVGTGAGTYGNLPKGTNEGDVLTISGGTVTWATPALSNYLPLAGGTMTGTVTFAAGQTISGYIANSVLSTTGDIMYASAANTPNRLGIGAAGSILAVNGGIPAWRTTVQLGLLTSATAASTYAPLNSPTFTGPVTINAGGTAGSNGLTVSGGTIVLSSSFTPASSGDTGSTGEIAWDSTYLYICTAPNTWGRILIDTTPF